MMVAEYFHMSHRGFRDAVIICGLDKNWQVWVPAKSSVTGPLKNRIGSQDIISLLWINYTCLRQPSPSLIITMLMQCLPPSPGPCWSIFPKFVTSEVNGVVFFLIVLLGLVFHQRSKELITYGIKLSKHENQNFPGTKSCLPLQNYSLKCIPIIHPKLNHIW